MLIDRRMTPQEVIDDLMRVDLIENVEKCHLYGQIAWVHEHHYDFVVLKGDRSEKIRVLQSVASYERDSYDTALIEIPIGLAETLGVAEFILTPAEVEKRKGDIAQYNAPHLPETTTKKPERIGSIRI